MLIIPENQVLEVLMPAQTTAPCEYTCTAIDDSTDTIYHNNGQLTSGGATTIVAAPGAGVHRLVKSISICNTDSASQLVTVRMNQGGTLTRVLTWTIAAGESILYSPEAGFIKSPSLASLSSVSGVLPIANGGTNSSAALTNNQLMASNAGAVTELGAMTDGKIIVGKTGALPQVVSAGGDVSTITNAGAITVAKVNGSTVPVGGALTTGNVLQVSGGAALTYGAVNLAGGANYVTGILPVANGGTGIASGTSGGVPYFSGATSIASSAALTQYGLVYGGGAGSAPVATAAMTDGQLIVGKTGAAPQVVSLSQDISTVSNTGAVTVAKMLGGKFIPSGPSGGNRTYTFPDADATIEFMACNAQSLANGGAYTATATDCTIKVATTATAGQNCTVNLPAAASNSGRILIIHLDSTSGGTCTIDANSSETIDGALTTVLYSAGAVICLQCDGTGWHTLWAKDYVRAWQALAVIAASGVWKNGGTTITISAGEWDLSMVAGVNINGGTMSGTTGIGISASATDPGFADAAMGDNCVYGLPCTAASQTTLVVPAWRVTPTATTTYYAKLWADYTVAATKFQYRISARRVG